MNADECRGGDAINLRGDVVQAAIAGRVANGRQAGRRPDRTVHSVRSRQTSSWGASRARRMRN